MDHAVAHADYDSFQDTGIPWLGFIPSHWELLRKKYLFNERVQKGFPDEPLLAATQSQGVVRKTDYEARTVEATKDFHLLKLVKEGDFVISLRSFEGGIEYAHYQGIISPAYTVLTPRNQIEARFYRHFLKSPQFIQGLKLFVTGIREGQNIDYTKLSRAFLPCPPPDECDRIANFLDQKTAEIDTAIAKKQHLIELLKEQKAILINQAVTKGLNPDVPMRDSGVEWIGEVPEHWKTLYNRRLFRETSRKITNVDETPLSLSQVDGLIPSKNLKERSLKPSHRDNFKVCLPGDLVVNRFKGHLGVFFECTMRGIVTFHYGVYRPTWSINTKFYELLFHTSEYKTIYAGASNGMTVGLQNLSNQNFYDVRSIVPPIDEQNEIVRYADKVEFEFMPILKKIYSEIETITELKSVMISEAVTGKIKL